MYFWQESEWISVAFTFKWERKNTHTNSHARHHELNVVVGWEWRRERETKKREKTIIYHRIFSSPYILLLTRQWARSLLPSLFSPLLDLIHMYELPTNFQHISLGERKKRMFVHCAIHTKEQRSREKACVHGGKWRNFSTFFSLILNIIFWLMATHCRE